MQNSPNRSSLLAKQNTHIDIKNNLVPGDWVKMPGNGFVIYGKVIECGSKNDEIRIVTSSVIGDRPKMMGSRIDMRLEKIDQKDVPDRARLWILARISHPPEEPTKVLDYQKPAGQ
jgi:hypothetical protein